MIVPLLIGVRGFLDFLSKKGKYPSPSIRWNFCYQFAWIIIGAAMGFWYYSGKMAPSFPVWLPFKFSIIFFIQTKQQVSSWKKALLFRALTAFSREPFMFHYICNFPIYTLKYVFDGYKFKCCFKSFIIRNGLRLAFKRFLNY